MNPDPVGRINFNEKLEGNSFTDTKDWKPMLSEWNAYAGEEFDVDLNNDDDDSEGEAKKGRKKGKKKDEYPLEVDSYRLLVIPDVRELNLESKTVVQPTTKGVCALGLSEEGSGDFIAAKFVPTGWKHNDPSNIWLADADRLLELWCQRQKDHVCPTFEFKGWEGDNKTMREPAEATSRKGSDTRCKNPVKKHTGKCTRRVEQESSSEDKEKGDDEEKDGDEEKDDNEEKDNDDNNGTSPPPKSKPVKKRLPVKKSRPVNACSTSPATSAAEHEDPRPPVKKFRQVLLPPKSKPTKKHGRVGHTQSDLESDSQSPRKKSKPNNVSTGSAQSTGHRDNHPPPSKSRAFGPTSSAHGKKKNHKGPVPKPKATGKKATGREAQTTDHEPKRSLRSAKASYKAQYMQ
ncbi:hypothetical protein BDR03DRAFT_987579 [Suillus americanus]|nr:hypothetical protein BDR03DRAFT_987579 [Suillus americanus]